MRFRHDMTFLISKDLCDLQPLEHEYTVIARHHVSEVIEQLVEAEGT